MDAAPVLMGMDLAAPGSERTAITILARAAHAQPRMEELMNRYQRSILDRLMNRAIKPSASPAPRLKPSQRLQLHGQSMRARRRRSHAMLANRRPRPARWVIKPMPAPKGGDSLPLRRISAERPRFDMGDALMYAFADVTTSLGIVKDGRRVEPGDVFANPAGCSLTKPSAQRPTACRACGLPSCCAPL